MLQIHHLNNSRSQRILWLLEELAPLPYEIVKYQRLSPIPWAPPELKKVHPLGKSPVITDNGMTIAESGAIIEYIIDTYGNGKMKPKAGTKEYWKYIEWMHFAEGSAALPFIFALFMPSMQDTVRIVTQRVRDEIANHLSYMEEAIKGRDFFVGNELTGADFQLLFITEMAGARLAPYPHLVKYRAAMQARPAYLRSVEKGGEYGLMSR